ncbi:MAG: PDDEXK nuclease domain-containing protein [Chitinivibrionales bacterium]|nr:PDDEXK nuclease domain-containing protein [Chitinivibrionales bacterium]
MKNKNNAVDLLNQIRTLIVNARTTVAKSADFVQVMTGFQIGRLIVENEQCGKMRAGYSEQILQTLSRKLTLEFGRGFARRNLAYMRQFYLTYKDRILQSPIAQSLAESTRTEKIPILQSLIAKSLIADVFKLSWTHYLFLMSIDDPDERSFYEIESAAQNWTIRELRRQFNTSLYERLALSRNKAKVKELSHKGQIVQKPEDAIKEPVVLEFLGLDEKTSYTETHLETAIINKIEHFLLEMGKGFLFEARQKRMTINDKHFHVDLVLYNRLLRCYVLIDLKIGEITHQDIGQMQMYVNYTDRKIKTPDENRTVGIILCRKKEDALVEISLPEENKRIFASRYKLFLPSKAQLRKQIAEVPVGPEGE